VSERMQHRRKPKSQPNHNVLRRDTGSDLGSVSCPASSTVCSIRRMNESGVKIVGDLGKCHDRCRPTKVFATSTSNPVNTNNHNSSLKV